MPNKDKNIPKRRFKAFENADAWELRKLGEVGAVAMCRRIFKEQTSEIGEIPFYKIGTFGGTPDAFISKELFEEYRNKYPYPTKGDILISASGSIGRTVEFLGKDEYFQDSNIVWLKHDGKIDNIFLKQFYSIVKWSGVEGSTIKRLYNENILNTEIALPSLLEQKAIGIFFSTLDRQITLHQRKLDKLKNVKQAYLSEMFPAEGERVPKRRFPGFTDDWELRKLGEVADVCSGRDYKHLETGSIPVYGTGGYMLSVSEALSKNEDAIGIGRKGTIDSPYILRAPFWTVDTLFYCIPQNDFTLEFAYSVFQNINWKSMDESTGVPSLSKNGINNVRVLTPKIQEQSAIGTFFSTLDSQITLHQRKLEKLKNLKKALLNELFV
ncbi:restriction endonuclease subunit S [Streptococcus suis]|uniref:restriction endonuclease subunit S n=2 Tax=Streptococcus suis TaxID=1307 RepID=UPI000CF5C762|nr:restriction endonuclease subunit S [Streptococcus suis]